MAPIVVVDICNTLADINAEIARVAGGQALRNRYGLEDLGYSDPELFFREHPEVFTRAACLPGSVKAMRKLAETCRIAYVSARPLWAGERTRDWLGRYGLPPGPLLLTRDKTAVMRRLRPLLAIEDCPAEAARISSVCPVLLLAWPYNDGTYTWSGIVTAL
jgi:hypothetical protein